MAAGTRADQLLVERGLFDSRAQAQAAIAAGLVRADGRVVRKAAERIAPGASIEAEAAHPWVSRGGLKLVAALDAFAIEPAGLRCLDVGASTGGFTDVLLARRAAHVLAVDAGRGQLHARLRADPRVTSLEATDIRALAPADLAPAPALGVVDVSFIPLSLVLPAVTRLLAPEAALVVLVKPQFEVGRAHVGKGGVVRDEAARADAVARVLAHLADLGWSLRGTVDSPVAGGDGNREVLAAARRGL